MYKICLKSLVTQLKRLKAHALPTLRSYLFFLLMLSFSPIEARPRNGLIHSNWTNTLNMSNKAFIIGAALITSFLHQHIYAHTYVYTHRHTCTHTHHMNVYTYRHASTHTYAQHFLFYNTFCNLN